MTSRCYYGHVITVMAALTQVCVYPGTSAGMTWVVDGICLDLHLSRGNISILYMIGTFAGAVLQPAIGSALDYVGGRFLLPVMAAIYAASLVALGETYSPVTLVLAWVLIRGLGIGGLALGHNVLLQNFWKRKRSSMSSFVEAVNAIGGFGFFAFALSGLVRENGWRRAYQMVGWGIGIALVVPSAVLLRDSPERMGLLPDGDTIELSTDDVEAPEHDPAAVSEESAHESTQSEELKGWTRAQALCAPAFWSIVLGSIYMATASAGVFFHLASITASAGMDGKVLAGLVFPTWAITRCVVILVTGVFMDRAPLARWLCLGSLLMSMAMFVLLDCGGPWQGIVFGLTLGCGGGVNNVVFRIILAEYFGRAHLGSISGVLQVANVAGTSIGPYFLGVAYDKEGDYRLALQCIVASGVFVASLQLLTGHPGDAPVPPMLQQDAEYGELTELAAGQPCSQVASKDGKDATVLEEGSHEERAILPMEEKG